MSNINFVHLKNPSPFHSNVTSETCILYLLCSGAEDELMWVFLFVLFWFFCCASICSAMFQHIEMVSSDHLKSKLSFFSLRFECTCTCLGTVSTVQWLYSCFPWIV